MKDSGVEWIGEIPKDWKIGRVKNVFIRKNEKARQENPTILSLARSGVKVRDISTGEGQIAESYYNYNPVEIGDLLLNPMDLYSGANCSISKVSGVISPAYIILFIMIIILKHNIGQWHYLLMVKVFPMIIVGL